MTTTKIHSVNNGDAGMQQKRGASASSAPIRIRHKTKTKMEQLLRQANKDRMGRRVKADDLISFSLGLVTDAHVGEICNMTLSNKDRLELMFRKVSKERRGISREEFFGLLLEGKIAAGT